MEEVLLWCIAVVEALKGDNNWGATWDEAMLVAEQQLREYDMYRPEEAELLTDDMWYSMQEQLAWKLTQL